MTDTPGHAPIPPTGAPGAPGLRPDPLGTADPRAVPGAAAGDFTLRPDPRGLHDPRPHAEDHVEDTADALRAGAGDAGERAAGLADHARDRVDQARERVADLAGDLRDRVQERIGGAADEARARVGDLHRQGLRRLDDLTVQGMDGLHRGRTTVERFVDENPLLVGVVGVAAGLLLGALLPRTRQEDRNLGPWADEVRDQGLRYAREMTHRGREFVQTALDPDNLNAAVRKAADTDAPRPPESERAQHNL
ncbi:hypothetical protein Q8W71_12345 [Methylobacterium sp. NEAU 140]|uniref:hypothetical protein n=1 Tax=Methylobacterium sp. NEAU 140 TaxID=3064945 RepID=UPI0027363451|nr:hypothetical protein [Methylobacterium sp. NEAU 140]MDP4023420.1 hypothetical protein [Methylobacterium sp. NEAU 140]